MIAANELRIGNWIIEDAVFHKWDIDDFESATCYVEGGNQYRLSKWYEPIPLTPEILEKCGFETNESGFIKGEIELWIANNEIHYSVHDDYNIPVNSVHQLQNLYFALTGEELNIEL